QTRLLLACCLHTTSSINPIIFEKVSKFTKFHSAKFHLTHFFPRISLYKSHQFFSFFFPIQFIPCFSLTLFFFSKMAISKQLIPFFSAAAVFLLLLHSAAAQPAVVRGGYWFPDSGFAVSAIESRHFTHLFCAFAGIDSGNFQLTVPAANRQQFMTFTQTVQSKNPSVRTLLSIGGGGANVATFAAMASQPGRRKSFIDTSISTARSFNFHGLDLDWEYPSDATQMANFGSLLTEWRAAVAAEARTSGKPPLLLSAAVLYLPYYYSNAVPYPAISNNLDWINVMSYDLYVPNWSPNSTGPPAALYGSDQVISVDSGIRSWLQQGLPATKIVLGLPFYGYAWQLLNSNQTGMYIPANGTDLPEGGAMTYGQINRFIEGWKSSDDTRFDVIISLI
ncbi:Class V chitinase, partial [Linum perenne]